MTTIEEITKKRDAWMKQALDQEKQIREIKESLDTVWALVMQSVMLELAEANPVITGFTFEANMEYDDEGGYYWCPQFYVIGSDNDELVDELMEVRGDEDQIAIAFDSKSSSEGEITVEELRAAWKGQSVSV